MDNKINEFLKQINQEIKKTEERIEEWRKELIKCANADIHIIEEFGTAKDAETLTKLTSKWKSLQEQKYIFESIFEIED